MSRRKIFNDPVYGFITIPYPVVFDIIEHPYFQRLRRIQQLGLTSFVYPSALHTRFHHTLGAMHLMNHALEVLKSKGHQITNEEAEAVVIAILLHDIGHGPFSHTLEQTLVDGVHHEYLSLLFMKHLNKELDGKLEMAIDIFTGNYPKQFLNQLVSSQLDMDRLDYLARDSFFTGVSEGHIGYDRIIDMLDVHNDELVIEEKGIYPVEKFLVARRLMYWQVYLHKTVISAEQMLVRILKRAKQLSYEGAKIFSTPALNVFLSQEIDKRSFEESDHILDYFSQLDDYDIISSVKVWMNEEDAVLSRLCSGLIYRHLLKIEIQKEPIKKDIINKFRSAVQEKYKINDEEAGMLVFSDSTSNSAYSREGGRINVLYKNRNIVDIAEASDQLNISVLSEPVIKYYLCFPKEISKN